jgi:hypothetical protein
MFSSRKKNDSAAAPSPVTPRERKDPEDSLNPGDAGALSPKEQKRLAGWAACRDLLSGETFFIDRATGEMHKELPMPKPSEENLSAKEVEDSSQQQVNKSFETLLKFLSQVLFFLRLSKKSTRF